VCRTIARLRGCANSEVIFTQTNLLGEETRLRTWRLLGELTRG
jgi:hypothetical protein